MLSHGYYSVISPEGAAAIEGHIRQGQRAAPELIEHCANNLHITAQDNLSFGYIDAVIPEPPLGARPWHFEFFRTLRQEVIRATDEVIISTRVIPGFRGLAMKRHHAPQADLENLYIRWGLTVKAQKRLVALRQKKFLRMSLSAVSDKRAWHTKYSR